jgi:hypothetical protein
MEPMSLLGNQHEHAEFLEACMSSFCFLKLTYVISKLCNHSVDFSDKVRLLEV